MRIVDVCAFYAPKGGGVKTYIERKLKAGSAMGQEIIILAPGKADATTRLTDKASIVTIESPHFPLDRRYRYFNHERALHHALDMLKPDMVEVSSPWTSASMVARWNGSARRSLVMHADPLSAYAYRWFGALASHEAIDRRFDWFWRHLRRLDARFDHVVSASENLSARLRAGGLTKVATHPMGVEPGIFAPTLRDECLRSRLLARCGLDASATLLLGIGRHAPEKRWPMVIEAVAAAGNARPVGLVLIGNGRDSRRIVRAAANNPHIHLAAAVDDRAQLAAILASADALVHGCEAETFCMVAAEARASGLPLIVPDRGGAADQFTSSHGARYRATDAAALARAIAEFLGGGPAAQRASASRSASCVRTMDDHFASLFAFYQREGSVRHAA